MASSAGVGPLDDDAKDTREDREEREEKEREEVRGSREYSRRTANWWHS